MADLAGGSAHATIPLSAEEYNAVRICISIFVIFAFPPRQHAKSTISKVLAEKIIYSKQCTQMEGSNIIKKVPLLILPFSGGLLVPEF